MLHCLQRQKLLQSKGKLLSGVSNRIPLQEWSRKFVQSSSLLWQKCYSPTGYCRAALYLLPSEINEETEKEEHKEVCYNYHRTVFQYSAGNIPSRQTILTFWCSILKIIIIIKQLKLLLGLVPFSTMDHASTTSYTTKRFDL